MNNTLKVLFNSDCSFTIIYITDNLMETEDDYKNLFVYFNKILLKKYDYEFEGFYDVTVYFYKGIYVFDFEFIEDYGRKDFNITIFVNSNMLYEFDDMHMFDCKKIYYNKKFYIEIDEVISDIRLFEYGRIVYGKIVDQILKNGILIS